MRRITEALILTAGIGLTSPLIAAEEPEEAIIKAKDIKVLPIAPQNKDGFEGRPQTSFSPPRIKNFSAEMLKQATKKSPKKKAPAKKKIAKTKKSTPLLKKSSKTTKRKSKLRKKEKK